MSERTLAERIGPVDEPVRPSHPDVAIWRPATADDIDLIHVMTLAADRVDHPAWVTPRDEIEEIFEASSYDPLHDTLLGLDADGRAVASGLVFIHPSRDVRLNVYLMGRVHPDVRGRGIGRELMRWEHERALQALTQIDTALPATLLVYAEEIDVPARHLAERRGFVEERWFSTMVRDLALEIPEITVGRGEADEHDITVIPYAADWSEATRLARNDAFRDHWGSLETPVERWKHFIEGPHLRPDLSWLAVEGDRVVALALGTVNEDDWEGQGYSSVYIDLIGVTRDRRGRRLAPAVVTQLLRSARTAGLEKAVLDVDTESPTGANSLYSRLGFEPAERMVAFVTRC
jgi:mycothiol synthase